MAIELGDILELSVAERVQLVEDIWDSSAAAPEALPLIDRQREELDRRIEAFERDPSDLRPWSEVRARLERQE